jgi:hypothetical protein
VSIVLVFQYVTADGNVEERFLHFTDVSSDHSANKKTKLNSMVWVRERAIPTERPPLDCQLVWTEGATWSAWRIPPAVFSVF